MKSKYLPLLLILSIIFISLPSKIKGQARLNVKINFVEQETRELEKLKNSGVAKRITFAKLAQAGTKQAAEKVEEMNFNKMGLLVEKTRFNYYKGIEERNVYKYNSSGILVGTYDYDGNNKLTNKEDTKFNKAGKPIEIIAETIVRNTSHKTRRTLKYDKNGLLLETKAFEKGKDFVIKETCEYKDGLLTAKRLTDFEGKPRGYETYEYDAQKRKIKETAGNITYQPMKDSVTKKMLNTAFEDKVEYSFKYDEKGRLTEIKATDYRQVFTYNDKGDFVRDIIYDNGGRKQNDNEFIYDEKGLLKQIIRYYGDGSPGAYIDYTYEFNK